jgi:hypothetical protein
VSVRPILEPAVTAGAVRATVAGLHTVAGVVIVRLAAGLIEMVAEPTVNPVVLTVPVVLSVTDTRV